MNAARLGKKRGEQLSQVLMGLILILFAFCCLFPMYLVLINSFATEASILKNGYQLIPEQFSLEAYKSCRFPHFEKLWDHHLDHRGGDGDCRSNYIYVRIFFGE